MSRRQEGPEQGGPGQPIMRKVSFEGIGAISALIPGTCTIVDAWVEVGGERVTEILVGAEFDIFCHYVARNEAWGSWKVTATVIGDGIENYEDTNAYATDIKEESRMHLDKMGANVMPDKDITLAFKLWLHDDTGVSPPYPPEEEW